MRVEHLAEGMKDMAVLNREDPAFKGRIGDGFRCAVCSVNCAVGIVNCTMCSVQCAMCCGQCTLYCVECEVLCLQCVVLKGFLI